MTTVQSEQATAHERPVGAPKDHYLPKVLECSGVERPTLRELESAITPNDQRIVVAGFTDYAKHLINLHPGQVIAVWDHDPATVGIRFRGVPVVSELPADTTKVIATRYADLYLVQQRLLAAGHHTVRFVYPNNLEGHSTRTIATHLQTPFYQRLLTDHGVETAVAQSMMDFDKIVFLVELLRSVASCEGDVVEIGVWQGGSAYFLALALAQLGADKNLHLFDFFEEHDPHHPKGIMCADEMERRFSKFDGVHFVAGDIRQTITQLDGQPLCFVHYDMGFQQSIVDVVADNIVDGGIILLDNYGHLAGRPGQFDSYFADRNLHVTRVPYTEQAIVFKNR